MDNDPALYPTIHKSKNPVHNTKKLEKRYSIINNTIKATETRLKLLLPPTYIKLKVQIPPSNLKLKLQIKQLCEDFFITNNTLYLELITNKLRETQSKLLKLNKSRDPNIIRTRINIKEWTQISKLDPYKTPLIVLNENIHRLKTNITFHQPKFYTKELLEKFITSKAELTNNLHTLASTKIYSNYKNIRVNNQDYTMNPISEYISIILPKNIKPTRIPPYVITTLNKGLNYTPHTNTYPVKSLNEEFNTFKYKLLWQNFFSKRHQTKLTYRIPPSKLNKNRIKQNPPNNSKLANFSNNIENIVTNQIKNTPKKKSSIDTRDFYKTKLFFITNPHFIVKPADKGSSIVIMHRQFYSNLGLDFLNKNMKSYRLLTENPLNKYHQKITIVLDQLKQNKKITKKLYQLIKPNEKTKTPNLYFLPKIHKLPNIAGRPISSSNSHPAENISIYLDHILKPYTNIDPIYLKDGTQLLQMLENIVNIPEHALVFSLDVINMYPSIPLGELIHAINKVINLNPRLLQLENKFPISTETVIALLKTVLYTNFSQFNSNIYKQIHGVAMGTPCACTITDIYMCNFVNENLFNWTYQPRLYKQYRDDSFGLWLHGESTLLQFLDYVNSIHTSIKFTLTYGKEIQFLDLKISLTNWGSIETETFYKSTDTFQYLHANSCHPPAIIKNIPKSQFLRHVRNCSTASNFLKHAAILKFNLLKRLYTKNLINKTIRIITTKSRTEILKNKQKEEQKRTPLIITYNSNLPNIKEIINNNLPTELLNSPPLLAYRIKRSVGGHIIKAYFD